MDKLFLISHKEEKLSQVLIEQAQGNKKIKILELAQFLLMNPYEEKIGFKNKQCFFPEAKVGLRVFSTPTSVLKLFHPSEHEYINFEILAFLESLKEFPNVRSTLGKGPLCTWNQSLIEIWENAAEDIPDINLPCYEFPAHLDDSSSKAQEWIYSSPNFLYQWKSTQNINNEKEKSSLIKYLRPEGTPVHILSSQKNFLILNNSYNLTKKNLNAIQKIAQKLVRKNSSWIEEQLYFISNDGKITLAFRSPIISSSVSEESLGAFIKQNIEEL